MSVSPRKKTDGFSGSLTDPLHLYPGKEAQRQIQENYAILHSRISSMSQKVTQILKSQEKDYLAIYKVEMKKVNAELLDVRKQLEGRAEAFNKDQLVLRLKAAVEQLNNETDRLTDSLQTSKKQSETWRFKVEELESENQFLARKIGLMKRIATQHVPEQKIDTIDASPINSKHQSLELSPILESTMASSSPQRSFDYDSKSPITIAISECARKYGIKDWKFLKEIGEIAVTSQSRLQDVIRHLQNTLEKRKRQVKGLVLEKAQYFSTQTDLQKIFSSCVQQAQKEVRIRKGLNAEQKIQLESSPEKFRALDLFCKHEFVASEIQKIMFPVRTPVSVLGELSYSVTPSQEPGLKLDSDPESSGTGLKSPRRKLRRRRTEGAAVVINGRLLLANRH